MANTTTDALKPSAHIGKYIIFTMVFMGFASAAYGYTASVMATTLTQPSFITYMHLDTAPNAAALIGATNGLFYTGGFFGCLFSGFLAPKYGRKRCAVGGSIVVLIANACLTGSVHISMFIVFRFFSGYGAFILLTTVPFWMAEISPPTLRGTLVDINSVMANFGYVAASYTGIGFYYYSGDPNNKWRGPIGLSLVFPTIFLCTVYWLPESPRYLLSKDRIEDAWIVTRRLNSAPQESNFATNREFYQMREQIALDASVSDPSLLRTYKKIFKNPSTRKRAAITIALFFSFMSSGALMINNYGSLIYANLGYGTPIVLQLQGAYQVTAWLMNMVAMLFVDRVKRPVLFAIGFFASAITVIAEAILQRYYLDTTSRSGLSASVLFLFLNTTCFSLFLEGASYTYIVEIWPSHLRGHGLAIGLAALNVSSIIWLQSAPSAFSAIGWKFYLFFIIIGVLAGFGVLLCCPDTLHKPLEEIAAIFGDEDTVAVYQRDIDADVLVKAHGAKLEVVELDA